MKKRIVLYVILSFLFSIAIEVVSYLWRRESELQGKYYIGALIILVFGGLELLFLYGLKKEVHHIACKNKRLWSDIVQFVFMVNCIGLPIYLIAFLFNCYYK